MRAPRLRIDHVAFPSFDAAATRRFYTEVMGFELVHVMEGRSPEWGDRAFLLTCFATGTGQLLDFFQVEGHERPASEGLGGEIRHLALATESRDELARWKERLASHGVHFEEHDHGGVHDSLYFRDPNGVQIEITWWNRRFPEGQGGARGPEIPARWTAGTTPTP